jgi:uncharacterized protein (DUF1684 family)
MRPLETHVEMTSHIWMFNRLKELLSREGWLPANPTDGQLRDALGRWIDMVEGARKDSYVSH